MVKITAIDAKNLYDPKLIVDNIKPLYETARGYNINALKKDANLAKEAGSVFTRITELLEQYKSLPSQHKNPKMDKILKKYNAKYEKIKGKLSQFVQYPQKETKSTQSIKGIEKKIELPKPLPKISIPDYILDGINEDAAKRDPLPLCYILGIESSGGCTANSFSEVSEAIDYYNKIDTSKGITRVILKTEKKDEKINFYPVELKELKTEKAPPIDQLVQAEIDKRGDKNPFYKVKIVENKVKEIMPLGDPLALTKTILPPGELVAYKDPTATDKYTASNKKEDIDAAVERYLKEIKPQTSSQGSKIETTQQLDVKKDPHLEAIIGGTAPYALTWEDNGVQKRFFSTAQGIYDESQKIVNPKKQYWEKVGDAYREIPMVSYISHLKKKIQEETAKKEDKTPEAKSKEDITKKPLGAGISQKDLAAAMEEVSKVSSQMQINEDKASRQNPNRVK